MLLVLYLPLHSRPFPRKLSGADCSTGPPRPPTLAGDESSEGENFGLFISFLLSCQTLAWKCLRSSTCGHSSCSVSSPAPVPFGSIITAFLGEGWEELSFCQSWGPHYLLFSLNSPLIFLTVLSVVVSQLIVSSLTLWLCHPFIFSQGADPELFPGCDVSFVYINLYLLCI